GIALYMQLGDWYAGRIQRPDLAVNCYQKVLTADPAHQRALEGMTGVYRRAQQWPELCHVLLLRVERAPTPERARDLRAEAAQILDTRLGDVARARALYEENLEGDPGHGKTVEALELIYQRNEDYAGYVRILQRQADAVTGAPRVDTLCKLGEIYEDHLDDLPEAEKSFIAALELDPGSVTALRGLDRILNRTGRYRDLLENLERQVQIAVTPRQKINLFDRMAGIYDEEFLDHEQAASCLEKILELDGGHEGALSSLMRHYRALDRWDDVIDLYDRSLRVASDDARRIDLLLAQGRVLLDFGSPERARLAYENVLQLDPENGPALESLATVRAATGDAMAALSAVDALAEKATDPAAKAEQWVRAAKILEQHGDRDGAIERYKHALDAKPDHPEAARLLRDAYLARGDAQSAVDLLTQMAEREEGAVTQARLYADIADIKLRKLGDRDGARASALRSLDHDATNVGSLLLLGDTAFEADSFREAASRYESLASRADVLEADDAKRVLTRYVDALSKTGSTEKAKNSVATLLKLAPDEVGALRRAARVYLDAKDFEKA
ncbi:MAG: tetratricopeptide repeat protein, partial [Myxococcota bacterium]